MQRINALYSGKWSDPLLWGNTDLLQDAAIFCNGNQIEVNTDIDIGAGIITNDQTYSDVIGGSLIISKENCVIRGGLQSSIQPVVIFTGTDKLTIIGNVAGGWRSTNVPCIINESDGIIEIIGNVRGGQSSYCPGILNKSNGTIIVNGIVFNGEGQWSYGICNENGGKVFINSTEITEQYIGQTYFNHLV